jgi:hypothetical protein
LNELTPEGGGTILREKSLYLGIADLLGEIMWIDLKSLAHI